MNTELINTDTLILYKLMVLYMLNKVDFPLSNSQISEFILDKGYANYFSLQQAIHELEDTELIQTKRIRNNSYYTLLTAGKDTLKSFVHKISPDIQDEIDQFFTEQGYQLKTENEITADYSKEKEDSYMVRCEIHDNRDLVLNLTLNVIDEKQAITVCDNWREKCEAVYDYLVHTLMIRSDDKNI